MTWAHLGSVEHAGQVGVDDGIPLLRLHAHHERVTCDARIVHQDVDRTPLVNRALDQPVYVKTLSIMNGTDGQDADQSCPHARAFHTCCQRNRQQRVPCFFTLQSVQVS